MKSAGATALAIDAGRTLLFDREALLAAANDARHRDSGVCSRSNLVCRRGTNCRHKGMRKEVTAAGEIKRIRVAVAGCGEFGRNHARVYREMDSAELVGIFDKDPERAQPLSRKNSRLKRSPHSTKCAAKSTPPASRYPPLRTAKLVAA